MVRVWNQVRRQPEDAVTFGNRLRFVDIALYDEDSPLYSQDEQQQTLSAANNSLPWPCLQFANVVEMLNVLQAQNSSQLNDRFSCPHLLHRINVEYMRHLQEYGGHEDDPVVFLFGKLTPLGNRLVFDYQETLTPSSEAAAATASTVSTTATATTSSARNNDNNRCLYNNNNNDDDDERNNPPASTRTRRQRRRHSLRLHDYKDTIAAAVDQMQGEPCFMNALNETSPILASLLSEEMQSPNYRPGPGEHAPAA